MDDTTIARARASGSYRLFAWVGSKQKMMKQLLDLVPAQADFGDYHEPFCGSASLFFNMDLRGKTVFLNDVNPVIANVLVQVRDRADELLEELGALQSRFDREVAAPFAEDESGKKAAAKAFYQSVLADFNATKRSPRAYEVAACARRLAALFVFVMALTYGAIYLESAATGNVIPGFGPRTRISSRRWRAFDPAAVRRAAGALSGRGNRVTISSGDFHAAIRDARAGDFVFLDPPYFGTRVTRYSSSHDFGGADQARLFSLFEDLTARGVKVMMTNVNTDEIRAQYAKYRQVPIRVRRDLARETSAAHEVAVLNY